MGHPQKSGEFDIIRQYFLRKNDQVILGVGDDCALLPRPRGALAVSTDMLLEGRHFFPDVDPWTLGHKALAVNLSDLAAMGAQPLGFTLGIALPSIDHDWLSQFSSGLFQLAEKYHCPLIGGDTTRSVQGVQISITVLGDVDGHHAIRRDQAHKGDDIWVSGQLGAAGFAVSELDRTSPIYPELLARSRLALELPEPRVNLGLSLRGIASAGLDISDGLIQDLGHILTASELGAVIELTHVPIASSLNTLPLNEQIRWACTGGDDYELCFCASPTQRAHIQALSQTLTLPLTRIGYLTHQRDLQLMIDGRLLSEAERTYYLKGFQHFYD